MTDTLQVQKLIRAVDEADSSAKLLEAVQNLAAVRRSETIPNLIATLGYNNPGAAVAAVDGLIGIGEPAVEPLLELIDGYNYGARAWAIRALAGIGDPRALNTLLDAAKNDFAFSVRRAAAKGLGTIQWHKLSLDEVYHAQVKCLEALLLVSQDPEWVVRYAAVVGLQALGMATSVSQSAFLAQICSQLQQMRQQDESVAVRARVQMALSQLQR
ncbi:MAG: HEAT repeat domain-containing protein [Nostocaceae cyanobacterium]|nr:HEAT repeat domain-containing protein [Nostocaceae cyanobacterium]